jgi:hypothetical protein
MRRTYELVIETRALNAKDPSDIITLIVAQKSKLRAEAACEAFSIMIDRVVVRVYVRQASANDSDEDVG